MAARITQQFPDIPFAELSPGSRFHAELHLTEELVREYIRLAGVRTRQPQDTVPPSLYCTFLPMFQAMGGRMEQGTLQVGQRIRVRRAVTVGTVLAAEVTVREAVEVHGRRQVVVETVFSDRDVVTCVSTSTYFWGYARR
ncbi:hypothetical protein GCM10023215_29600 [Pseudonocardia yuanmonensis]|uniref:N-terminal of MaoC-like dehydratase domain-containing protein n=1 Tax=Pseudonocardia yuanmonensis TaxID=1095914 RepID=A0ABP8WK11_9PSEU